MERLKPNTFTGVTGGDPSVLDLMTRPTWDEDWIIYLGHQRSSPFTCYEECSPVNSLDHIYLDRSSKGLPHCE